MMEAAEPGRGRVGIPADAAHSDQGPTSERAEKDLALALEAQGPGPSLVAQPNQKAAAVMGRV